MHPTPRIPNSCCCITKIPAVSQKASSDDISGTKRGSIDPVVSKRPEKNSEKEIFNKKNWSKTVKMVPNGSKWSKMIQNGLKW